MTFCCGGSSQYLESYRVSFLCCGREKRGVGREGEKKEGKREEEGRREKRREETNLFECS